MNRLRVGYSFAILILAACTATPVKEVAVKDALEVNTGTDAKPVQLKKVVVKIDRGAKVGDLQVGLLCIRSDVLTWKGGRINVDDDDFTEAFRDELEKAGYPVVGNPDALFEDPSEWKAELLVGGLITELAANYCYPMAGFGNFSQVKGNGYVKVNWQIFSSLQRRVVYEVATEGSFDSKQGNVATELDPLINAFAIATKNLLADSGFHDLVTGERAKSQAVVGGQVVLPRTPLFENSIQDHINTVRGGVVTVFVPGGHGSGFFVSSDGYVLTNEHVVRDAKFVQVKLPTGREILAEVVARNPERDVALIKVEESQMLPLPIRVEDVGVGADVYAIGSPLEAEFNTTLSRGVVSGYRVEDGVRFIQSDVNILPGSSGGPLVDKNGNVVGLSVAGVMRGGATTGINFFIPIGEALSALNVKLD